MPVANHPSKSVASREPIAIIGIGCRFPGGADNPDAFWALLANGVDAICDVPPDRWDLRRFYDPNPDKPGKTYARQGGFLKEPVDRFDAQFFGISPREAAKLDPQQRLLLEVVWEALEDAGRPWEQLSGSETGVYIGGFTLDSKLLQLSMLNRHLIDSHSSTGATMTMLANRISYVFDFRGPSMTIDTACSASLVAFHYACQDIWNGVCPLAVAGGVNVMIRPEYAITMSKGHFLSPDGRCKAFDARANGYARGEGAGIVVLKPLSQARADGDAIYALVLGSGVNQDGHTPGITLPNRASQTALMQRVYRETGIDPGQVQYIEAHGTGTQAGDTTEAAALGEVLGKDRPADRPCLVGSVKTNIGHLEAAAGIAGLIKTVLCLKHRAIPPNLHFEMPNPAIPFEDLRLRVPRTLETWPDTDGPLLAGINSFGYGGTNAHVLLRADAPETGASTPDDAPGRLTVFPVSARSEQALRAMAQAYQTFLSPDGPGATASLRDMAFSAATRRSHHPWRLAVMAGSRDELKERLQWFGAGEPSSGVFTGRALPRQDQRLVFVYTGMGAQWWAMGRELLETECVFREAVARCDRIFQGYAGWSLMDALLADETHSRMAEPEVAQTTNFALQIGLTALWRSWGIEPEAVTGHSVGEVAAAYTAGMLSLDDAVKVSYHRSRVQQGVNGQGRMLATGLSEAEARALLNELEGLVSIAGINSRASVVLSGDPVALEEIAEFLEGKQVYNRFLFVNVAYHSYQMDPLKDDLTASLEALAPSPPQRPIYSTVTGRRVETASYDAAYWWENVRQPVRFSDALDAMIDDGYRLFMEIGPHPVLSLYIQEGLTARQAEGRTFASLHRKKPERAALLEAASALYCSGYPVDWQRFAGARPGRYIKLPLYPWQRETYFFESDASKEDRLGVPAHPLLGRKLRAAGHLRETELNHLDHAYLKDHVIDGAVVFPGAGYVEAGLALDHALFDRETCVLESLRFLKALILDDDAVCHIQVDWDPKTQAFGVYSSMDSERRVWTHHAEGRLLRGRIRETPSLLDLDAVHARCKQEIETGELYAQLHARGLQYGPAFQTIKRVWRCPGEALVEIRIPDSIQAQYDVYRLHPAVLDAGFQTLIAAMTQNAAMPGVYMPVEIERVEFYRTPPHACLGYGRLTAQTPDTVAGDVVLCDTGGEIFAAVKGVRCRALPSARREEMEPYKEWLYAFQWQEAPLLAPDRLAGTWLVFDNGDAASRTAINAVETAGGHCIRIMRGNDLTAITPEHFEIDPDGPEDLQRLVETLGAENLQGAVYLWGFDDVPEERLAEQSVQDCVTVTRLVQALAGCPEGFRLALVTRMAQRVNAGDGMQAVAGSALWGLGRVIMNEHPELGCALVDMDDAPESINGLTAVLARDNTEEEVGVRKGVTYVRRLMRTADGAMADTPKRQVAPDDGVAFELEVAQPGILDSLHFRETTRRHPGPGEIEIRVHTVALNFKDVMKAMGMLSDAVLSDTFFGHALGMECAGVVTAVGEGVASFQTGQEVLVLTGEGCFRAYLTVAVDDACIIPKPAALTMEEAPVIVPYLTAYYALHEVARLDRGERVLIHAATGGVGLAAVHCAQSVGAEVFATAGSPEKRAYLKSLGVRYVMDSRSLAFADEVMAWTDGQGVDVVLNSLSGEALTRSLSVLAPYGRFIEIGKRDIDENSPLPMRPFNKNLTFAAIDLDRMLKDRRAYLLRLLREVCDKLSDGSLRRLPVTPFPAAETAEAFRHMAQARHMGKVVVTLQNQTVPVIPLTTPPAVRADGTYLITGGLGGFGMAAAKWLAAQGARHLVLAGRSGAASPEAQAAVAELKAGGVDVRVEKTDVSRYNQVAGLIKKTAATMPPLRGIIHAAGILADERLIRLDRQAFERVMAPKAAGAWHLHRATQTVPLDFFILFSSVSALVGNPGQGNYAAANAFLDGLAHYRRTLGLPATSINWGALTGVGMAARQTQVLAHLERMGLRGFTPEQALHAMEKLLHINPVQIGVMDVDWQQWGRVNATCTRSPRFAQCISASEQNGRMGDLLHILRRLDEEARMEWLQNFVREQVVRVLKLPASRLDVDAPLMEQGMDSLLAVELLTAMQVSLDIELSQMDLMKGASVAQLARELRDRLNIEAENGADTGTPRDPNDRTAGKIDATPAR